MNNIDSNLWEIQINRIIEKQEKEFDNNFFGYDSGGRPYTREDARSSYDDDRLHEMREEDAN